MQTFHDKTGGTHFHENTIRQYVEQHWAIFFVKIAFHQISVSCHPIALHQCFAQVFVFAAATLYFHCITSKFHVHRPKYSPPKSMLNAVSQKHTIIRSWGDLSGRIVSPLWVADLGNFHRISNCMGHQHISKNVALQVANTATEDPPGPN